MRIDELMTADPCCVQQDEPLRIAHRLMRMHKIRHLPVLQGERLVGLVSERDLYLLETVRSVNPEKEPVEEAMTGRPYAIAPATDAREVVEEMLARRYGSAVVVDGGRVVGIFTRADALRALRDLLR